MRDLDAPIPPEVAMRHGMDVPRGDGRDEAIARYIERYAQRLANGPAVREFKTPINRHRYDAEETKLIVSTLNAVASSVRAGLPPESDWPDAPLPETVPFVVSTGDPAFDPHGEVVVNGYRFVRALP